MKQTQNAPLVELLDQGPAVVGQRFVAARRFSRRGGAIGSSAGGAVRHEETRLTRGRHRRFHRILLLKTLQQILQLLRVVGRILE